MSTPRPFDRLDYTYKVLVVIALAITATILASDIVVPLAFAAFLSVVMLPVVKKLERKRLGPALSIIVVLAATVIVLGLMTWLVVDQVVGLVNDLPNLQTKFENYINHISTMLRQDFGVSLADQNKFVGEAARTVSTYLGAILISTTNTLSVLIQIPIYIFLILIYRDKFKAFFLSLVPGDEEFAWKKDMERVIQGYISGLTWVTLIIAALNCIGLLALGIDHAIFFWYFIGCPHHHSLCRYHHRRTLPLDHGPYHKRFHLVCCGCGHCLCRSPIPGRQFYHTENNRIKSQHQCTCRHHRVSHRRKNSRHSRNDSGRAGHRCPQDHTAPHRTEVLCDTFRR